MAKTYTAAGSAVAGDVYTATAHNIIVTDVNNFIVPPACRARRAAAQSLANGSIVAINFDTEDIDTDGMFSPTNNRITIQTAGMYILTACISYVGGSATGNRLTVMYLNPTFSGSGDTATITAGTIIAKGAAAIQSTTDASIPASTLYSLAANDVIAVASFQNSGGAINTDSVANPSLVHLSATWVGRTS